jgi:phenylacetate-CoA ligase
MEEFYQSHAFWPPVVGVRRQELYLRDPARENLPRINEFKPDVIDSFGSYLTILFRYIEETGEEFHPPKVVLYDSDGMSDSVKRLIEGKFKTPVFSRYGAAEAMAIGFDCPRHSGLHVNIDLYPVRVVDSAGKSVVNGETGELVVSNLINRGTVLLNYLLGDIAALLPNQCVCGRSLPLLSYPLGRSDDLIQLPSGDVIHHHAVRAILVEEDLWEFQVVQQTGTRFKVEIVPTGSCDLETTKTRIAEKFAETFGENITVEISFVDSIERTGAGKFRRVISLVNSSQDEMVNGTERR